MQKNCAIWPSELVESGLDQVTGFIQYDSPRAGGMYAIDSRLIGSVAVFSDTQRARLTTWVVDQHRSGVSYPIITADVLDGLNPKRKLRLSDKKRRFFEALVSLKFALGHWIDVDGEEAPQESLILSAWTECENNTEFMGLIGLLESEDLIARGDRALGYGLTPSGYEKLEQAELGGANTTQAFVAMWFDPALVSAYDDGIKLAIEDAGFEPFRIDRKEHNNKIDDEIVAEIRRSRFVVADFTCGQIDVGGKKEAQARGGVYYEAGFAQGLGTPVIWTVHSDCIDYVHFDTRQFAHITWNDPADLRTKLLNRIRATIPGAQ